jgi:hypothetical protein
MRWNVALDPQRWAVIGLEPGLWHWTAVDLKVQFQGFELLLRPETEDQLPTVAVRFAAPAKWEDAAKAARRFLSAFAWMHAGAARVEEAINTGSSGNPIRAGKSRWHPKAPPAIPGDRAMDLDHLQEPDNDRAWLALAFYREALNLNSDPYRFLGFFKIINILANGGARQMEWIRNALPALAGTPASARLREIEEGGCSSIPEYLYGSGRCAVAHAFGDPLVDPDDPVDLMRLRKDLPVIRALAEHAIERDLRVKSRSTVCREHLYHLAGFRDLLSAALLEQLKRGEPAHVDELPAWPTVSLRFRNEPVFPAFECLLATTTTVENGAALLLLESEDHLVQTKMILDFKGELLGFDFDGGVVLRDDGSPTSVRNALDHVRMLECCLRNGQFEVWDSAANSLLGRTDAIIPININSRATHQVLQEEATRLRNALAKMSETSGS